MTDVLAHLQPLLTELTPRSQTQYLWHIRRFVDAHPSPEAWDQAVILRYLQDLREQGWKPSSLRKARGVLKTVFDKYERPWPRFPRGMFAEDILDQERPALSEDELRALITAAVGAPWPELAGMVALSTVYGVRGGEIAAIRAKDLRLAEGVIEIPTGKRGAPRVHRIPTEILPFLLPKHFPGDRSSTEMWGYWRDLEHRAGIPHRPRQGWHSARRGVTIALLDAGVPERDLEPWMGWRAELEASIRRYGLRPSQARDQVVFSKHPFLPVWAYLLKRAVSPTGADLSAPNTRGAN